MPVQIPSAPCILTTFLSLRYCVLPPIRRCGGVITNTLLTRILHFCFCWLPGRYDVPAMHCGYCSFYLILHTGNIFGLSCCALCFWGALFASFSFAPLEMPCCYNLYSCCFFSQYFFYVTSRFSILQSNVVFLPVLHKLLPHILVLYVLSLCCLPFLPVPFFCGSLFHHIY